MYEVNEPPAVAGVTDIGVARAWRASGKVPTHAERDATEHEARRVEFANWLGLDPEKFALIEKAAKILDEHRDFANAVALTSPKEMGNYLKIRLGHLPSEAFAVVFLDNQHRMLGCEVMFHGTIDGVSVHPRDVVREALRYNCAAVVVAHNHPSGQPEASAADRSLTAQLRDALQLVGVRLLDHIIIGAGEPTSMAARGLI